MGLNSTAALDLHQKGVGWHGCLRRQWFGAQGVGCAMSLVPASACWWVLSWALRRELLPGLVQPLVLLTLLELPG
jgi:hypothetical protein